MANTMSLNTIRTPEAIRLQRAAPHPFVTDLYKRLTNVNFADSLEVRVMLLAHMTFHIYKDLKETQTI